LIPDISDQSSVELESITTRLQDFTKYHQESSIYCTMDAVASGSSQIGNFWISCKFTYCEFDEWKFEKV